MDNEKLVKYIKDPRFYLENFVKIKGKTPGLMPFVLNPAQLDIFNTLRTQSRTIILKARQIGFSTAITGWLYHKTITTPGTNTALIGYNSDLTAEILDKVKTFWRTTDPAIRPQIQYNSKHEISFPAIDSKIVVLPSTENVGRGYTLHNVLLTELAFWEKSEEKMAAIENSVPKDGRIIIESTPNGLGNTYHRMWMADNGYAKKKYGWWWHYSEQEIDEIRKRINNPMKFSQEYELEFLSSGRLVFDKNIVERMRPHILNVGEAIRNDDGTTAFVKEMPDGLRIYKEPVPGRMYVVGGDVAEGVIGGDYSVAIIFDRETGEEVAYWRGHIPADKFGGLLDKWGRLYNEALMVVEMNNHGLTTLTALKNLLYPRMYFRPSKFDSVASSWSDRLGWRTTRVTRPLMIDDAAEMLREGSIIIHSQEVLNEMLTFVYDAGGNMICQKGFHDDSIFSLAICLQGFKTMSREPLDQLDYQNHLPTSFSY